MSRPTWQERKRAAICEFWLFRWRWKLRPCGACAGSGHYDHDGAPACGACEGTGKERYRSHSDDLAAIVHRTAALSRKL